MGIPYQQRHDHQRKQPGYRTSGSSYLNVRTFRPGHVIHDLRHGAATLLLSKGVPVKVVSEMLGHSDVGITLSIYAHVLYQVCKMGLPRQWTTPLIANQIRQERF